MARPTHAVLGKTKIGRFSSKPNVIYPQLRLPQDRKAVIGETAHVCATEHEGKKAFLFVLEERKAREGESDNAASQVLQLNEAVLQQLGKNSIENRLSTIESQIAELKSLLLEKRNQKAPQSPLFRQSTPENQWARPDSNRRSPPCQ